MEAARKKGQRGSNANVNQEMRRGKKTLKTFWLFSLVPHMHDGEREKEREKKENSAPGPKKEGLDTKGDLQECQLALLSSGRL